MKDVNYLEVARNDPTWREVVASMQISGFDIDTSIETLAGLIISGELTFASFIDIVALPSKGGSKSIVDAPPPPTEK